jgi:hypothetical protein
MFFKRIKFFHEIAIVRDEGIEPPAPARNAKA